MGIASFHNPLLSRRGFLVAGTLAVSAPSICRVTPACTLTHEQEEGPYYIDDETLRRDITEGKPGVPLLLTVKLVNATTCAPLPNSALDIWHCDAQGVYSGFTADNPNGGPGAMIGGPRSGPPPPFRGDGFAPGMPPPDWKGGPPPGPRSRHIDAARFLRGVQITDDNGIVEFSTLYPGWYFGRAIHVHLKAHLGGGAAQRKYSGGHVAHTGQLFFPEDLTERIARLQPYAKRLDVHRTSQAEDEIFSSQHGAEGMLSMQRLGRTDADGFRAAITLAIDPETTPAPVGFFGGRGPGGPRPRR